jgi:ribonucleotide reductase beta subunit family protein with ferritin-like domain
VTEIHVNDPQTLYRRWEESQWSPFAIDLTRDVEQWPTIAADVRELLLFVLCSLMVAEERITTKFSGLVGAHGSEEEATFWPLSRSMRPGTCSSTPATRTR